MQNGYRLDPVNSQARAEVGQAQGYVCEILVATHSLRHEILTIGGMSECRGGADQPRRRRSLPYPVCGNSHWGEYRAARGCSRGQWICGSIHRGECAAYWSVLGACKPPQRSVMEALTEFLPHGVYIYVHASICIRACSC